MNKVSLIEQIAQKTSLPKSQILIVLAKIEEIITTTLQNGEEVSLTGFGTFMPKKRHARFGVNPLNPKEKIQMPEVTVPKFKAGQNLKKALKNIN